MPVEKGGKLPWVPIVTQKFKVHQNAPFLKEKFKNFLPRGALRECFPRPRCGSRWVWLFYMYVCLFIFLAV